MRAPAPAQKLKLVAFILLLSLAVTACDGSRMGAVSTGRLTPEEQGVTELLEWRVEFIVSRQRDIVTSLANYQRHHQAGNTAQAEAAAVTYFGAFDNLAKHLFRLTAPDGPPVLVPDTMKPLFQELVAFEQLRHSIRSLPLTDNERGTIRAAVDRIAAADQELAATWSARPLNFASMPFSSNVTLEVAGLPLKLDITNGEAKLKYTNSIGPFKTTFQGGFTSHSGIKTLIIQNRHHRRYFAIGGRPIEVYVPASLVRTAGSTMTIIATD